MRLASTGDIPAIGRVSPRTASKWVQRPDFPAPLDVTACGPIWDRAELEAWVRDCRPRMGRPRGANHAPATRGDSSA